MIILYFSSLLLSWTVIFSAGIVLEIEPSILTIEALISRRVLVATVPQFQQCKEQNTIRFQAVKRVNYSETFIQAVKKRRQYLKYNKSKVIYDDKDEDEDQQQSKLKEVYFNQSSHIDTTYSHLRRNFLRSTTSVALRIAFFTVSNANNANAVAGPITVQEAENLSKTSLFKLIKRFNLRPKPIQLLRQRIEQRFAIVLMRSSYNAVDELDCIPMNQFQRDFFLIRSAEYEPYIKQLGGSGIITQQGDLSDPYYFDCISLAQYETINRCFQSNPAMIFEEQQSVEALRRTEEETPSPSTIVPNEPEYRFESVIVRRNPEITNAKLGPEHEKRVGESILKYLDETFSSNPATALPKGISKSSTSGTSVPSYQKLDIDQVEAGLNQLLKLFLINGFAWNGSVERMMTTSPGSSAVAEKLETKSTTQFCFKLASPATFWSGQVLQYEQALVQNDFFLKTAKALVKRLGYTVVSSSLTYDRSLYKECSYLTIV